ncbi:MarR family winged helix-turn-helix transcriptional regulator [Paeniglutamicibacter cryotolerans]|uniref:DNA-binding MarR family transcriptional regulator n=1 Tax=Paeniglutamicibacter cryotolerans TaxID=670079 RepID=A0A839QFV3_9MICC|nr:MarR family winged helix-turn-helix transcriptional regulator [Paeniglutamicibacter cryotolerans]MBB2994503.1 DNA-binding MarR family transcriptional regulator [Paeniglutamicibacter cryotolerans]
MATKTGIATAGIERFLGSELAGDIEFLAARTRSLGSARANRLLAPMDLKVRSYSVLSLACSNLAPTQRDLAEFLSLDPSQIVPLVDALEARGLVERHPDLHDRRSKVVAGTEEGHKLYLKARRATAAGESVTMSNLSEAERTTLRELLSRIAFDS